MPGSEEHWKNIPGFPEYYEVSTLGRVRSCARGKMKQIRVYPNRYGYLVANLRKDGRKGNRQVHRLVLLAFRGPAPEGHQCDHINGDRVDNRLENLRWVTRRENIMNPNTQPRCKFPAGMVRCLETGEVFDSVSEAARRTGACRSHIGEVCTGKAMSTRGLRFAYVGVRHA